MNNSTCFDDLSFGPTVVHCRQGLDFTLQFEESIFNLLPACLILLISPIRVWHLRKKPKRVFERSFANSKLTNIAILAIIKLVLAIIWAFRAPILTKTSIVSAAISFCEVIAVGIVSQYEHIRNYRPSSLLCIALAVSIIFDVVRARTLIKMNFDTLITSLYTASIATKTSVLLLEIKDKRVFLRSPDTEKPPEETSGIFNRSVFWWLTPLLKEGYRKVLIVSDLWHLDERINSPDLKIHFNRTWERYSKSKRKQKLSRSSFYALKWLFLSPVVPNLLYAGATFAQPFLISKIISFVSSKDEKEVGYLLVIASAAVYSLKGIFCAIYWHEVDRWLTVLRGCLVSTIYEKTLRLDLRQTATGSSVALMSTDVEKAILGLRWIHEAMMTAVVIPISLVLLYRQVQLAFLAPIFMTILCTFVASQVSNMILTRQKAWLQETQKRVHFTSSVIAAMRGVKMMGLASKVESQIMALRNQECAAGLKWRFSIVIGVTLSTISDEGAKWLTFIVFAMITYLKNKKNGTDDVININILFTSLAILNIFLERIRAFIQTIPGMVGAFGCFIRIEEFLLGETKSDNRILQELAYNQQSRESADSPDFIEGGIELGHFRRMSTEIPSDIITMNEMSAGWTAESPILNELTINIKGGDFTALIGPVGCGKSTLLQTILGETVVQKGFIRFNAPLDSIAYCAQTPWLVNKTIRENIVGFSVFDSEWYKEVVRCCALLEDLKLYHKGDRTLVGTKGVVLSGGQKHRIALARAVYSRKKIILLDDIFSGLDAITEERIFVRLLGAQGLLRKDNISVILATHAVHRLPSASNIIALSKEGQVQFHGNWNALTENPSFPSILKEATKGDGSSIHHEGINDDEQIHHEFTHHEEDSSNQTLIDDATRKTGDLSVYRHYFESIGLKHSLLFWGLVTIEASFGNVLSVWLNKWGRDSDSTKTWYYMGIYSALVAITILGLLIWVGHAIRWPMHYSSINLHHNQLKTLMKGKMSYFSSTDVGVTTNRFSQDLMLVDVDLPLAMINASESMLFCFGLLGVSMAATPWMGLSLPFLCTSFYYLQKFYLHTSRQMRLLDIEAKSPLYTNFQETLSGVATIRAYGWENDTRSLNEKFLSISQKPFYYLITVQRWLGMVLDFIVTCLAVMVALLAVELRGAGGLNAGYIGLALLNTMLIGEWMKNLVVSYTTLETSLGAIARMKNFSNEVEQEEDVAFDMTTEDWPAKGNIAINELYASHKVDSEMVLNHVNLYIPSGAKIAFCGRSGSGKSSLISTLFRLLEIKSGNITIDGIDITDVPINTLRGRINVLSQEPFFLAGTVRENMSYANVELESMVPDENVWNALEKVGLKDKVLAWEKGLDTDFDPEGSLSHGERQLFCLARAMLKPSSIVVLDEFTSSVDIETDEKMQKLLRECFQGRTIITVAHRLNTILDYDTVVVLDKGIVVEQGVPQDLVSQPGSSFKALYDVFENESS